ncbi:MAG: hypothetical protein PUJ51_04290 [Clostridiales bacterium]|uniref:hypothetical protein n=1 Tax=Terrisporobacter sp. TaxID=1965305 RepID=UPI002A547220|nr:hypothetical protein [Terrisporobacter sp.]MDD7753711.1 hypothetical protein [Clostridiales bacterium]MDY4134359.1 hypothetical protein [Terrisporobacter sp.]
MNNNFNKFAFNDAMILDKIQEILEGKNIDELELTEEELKMIRFQLEENLSSEELNESSALVASSIEGLDVLPNEDIKEYIKRLIKYLNNTNLKCIIGEFKGIEFEVFNDSDVDDVFNDYYSKYDQAYGISQMLSDLDLLK